MLRSLKQLYGDKLKASDGEIGHIKDFYFDDQDWAVRYVVVDTGDWLSGRLVLISPHAFRNFALDGVALGVNLTRSEIEKSPALATHKPVSRQYEEEYYRYYGWPDYWSGDGLWGANGFPTLQLTPQAGDKSAVARVRLPKNRDAHLQSAQSLHGYHIQAGEDTLGHVKDFIVHDKSWAICHVVVKTGHWFSSKEIALSPQQINRISYEESKVFVNVTKEEILKTPEYHTHPWAYEEASK